MVYLAKLLTPDSVDALLETGLNLRQQGLPDETWQLPAASQQGGSPQVRVLLPAVPRSRNSSYAVWSEHHGCQKVVCGRFRRRQARWKCHATKSPWLPGYSTTKRLAEKHPSRHAGWPVSETRRQNGSAPPPAQARTYDQPPRARLGNRKNGTLAFRVPVRAPSGSAPRREERAKLEKEGGGWNHHRGPHDLAGYIPMLFFFFWFCTKTPSSRRRMGLDIIFASPPAAPRFIPSRAGARANGHTLGRQYTHNLPPPSFGGGCSNASATLPCHPLPNGRA